MIGMMGTRMMGPFGGSGGMSGSGPADPYGDYVIHNGGMDVMGTMKKMGDMSGAMQQSGGMPMSKPMGGIFTNRMWAD